MVATKEKSESTLEHKSFRSVPLVAFRYVNSGSAKLYCLRENDTQPVLLHAGKKALTKEEVVELKKRGHAELYVIKQEFPYIAKKMLEVIDQLIAQSAISVEIRFALLQIAYSGEIERVFHKAYLQQFIGLTQELSAKIATLLQQDEVSTRELFRSVHQSETPYAHLTNTAAYAVVLAMKLEAYDPEDYEAIAMGCLLHEVGKLFVPKNLLQQTGRLSIHDRQELEKIPQIAYESLCEFDEIKFGQLMMAYQQHERIDGTGYPVRTLGEDIHPWAKLLSVVDVFDSVTSSREYRSALSLREALLKLADGAKTQFEPEMVLCWITSFQLQ